VDGYGAEGRDAGRGQDAYMDIAMYKMAGGQDAIATITMERLE
jgi:hypothetical protein